MNKAQEVENEIKALLASDVSSNELSRKADISLSTVSRLRNGKMELGNITLTNAKKLYKAVDELDDLLT
ncbi:helix-turn-helix transcriptional regulator [Macrococcus armenti]|uniref:helix-turn-helix domain-containing protein n=1 Tax=Macrococcus armenti TaxID=2875764 RepID=UPI001CD026D2|nr:helix-turn-helix domain-containing protein [Macrococcus armenti]UBH21890.1 helix-turn-helix transcriptional regulator [Macrococcus armenti]